MRPVLFGAKLIRITLCARSLFAIISNKVAELNIDTLCFNNRGSEIIKYCQKENGEKALQGTAYEDVEECFYDIVGAIKSVVDKRRNFG